MTTWKLSCGILHYINKQLYAEHLYVMWGVPSSIKIHWFMTIWRYYQVQLQYTGLWQFGGTTTRDLHRIQLLCTDNSWRLEKYDLSSGLQWLGQPDWTYWSTLDNWASLNVHLRMWCWLTGDSSICSTSNTISGGVKDSLLQVEIAAC